ncbi:MAG: hypothetical protein ACK5R4_05675 [Alphaproteobacteria bacterium]
MAFSHPMPIPFSSISSPASAHEPEAVSVPNHTDIQPKIGRRPAHWPTPVAEAPAPSSQPPAPRLAWQQDLRFILRLLALVIALNLLWIALSNRTEYQATTTLPLVQQWKHRASFAAEEQEQTAGIESYVATPENRRILRQMVIETLPLETVATQKEP